LRHIFGDQLQVNESLARYTTARVGGPAELLLTVTSTEQLLAAVDIAYAAGIAYFVMGGGSNVLIADGGISGLVILNRARKVGFRHSGASVVCTAESGANLSALARQCISKGLGGLEWAIGIPGTVGGAVVGNAGAHGADIDSNLLAATIWEPGFGVRVYNREDMGYSYRHSVLKRDQEPGRARRVVLSAEFRLKPEPVDVLTARGEGFNAHRKERQPGGASTGSMFKNPENYYAGYLIDTAGLKGFRVGNAVISEKHANFFINEGEATAEDVRSLIAEAWNSVREQYGIEMELEVELVGDWLFE
jgi:UDP-N-acetylmuramate dehydrogenase